MQNYRCNRHIVIMQKSLQILCNKLQVPFMGFVLIWRSRCKFRRTGCNASVSGYSIAGFPQSHLCRCGALKRLFVRLLQHNSRFRISHGHLALGSGFCNTSLSGYLSAGGHDVTVLVADCLCNESACCSYAPPFFFSIS